MSAYITQEGLQAIARELSSRYGQSPKRLSDGGYQVNCPGHDDGHPSCSLHVRDGKLLVHCHAGCSQDIVYAKIKELYPQYFGNGKKTLTWQIAWEKNSRPADTETLQRYFMDGRGIPLSKAVLNILKKTLKINEFKGTFSLLAPISKSPGNSHTGTLQTYLKKEGFRYVKAKSTQFTDGSKAKGSAYWIDTGSNILVIAEGLETGLSFLSVVPGISLAVVGSASILPTLDIPNRFTEVNILVDCDLQDKTGQLAAIKAAKRYQKAGKSVYLVTPTRDTFSEKPAKKKDFNDLSPTEIMEMWQARETLAEVLERYRPSDVVKGGVGAEKVVDSGPGENQTLDIPEWPVLSADALPGIVGEFVKLATEDSEADPAGVLITLLTRSAAEIGPGPYYMVGETPQRLRLSAVLVGDSSKARKGTSAQPVKNLFRAMEATAKVSPGPFSSGEGIIYFVRDEILEWVLDKKTGNGKYVVKDPGVKDKRLFVLDEEFGGLLAKTKVEGSILSMVIRRAWDDGNLAPLVKNNKIKATGAHLCWLSHITTAELKARLQETEALNGFGNRILWICVRRPKLVPRPQPIATDLMEDMADRFKRIINQARDVGQVVMTENAGKFYDKLYVQLTESGPGMYGVITDRAETQVIRLSLLYALLDECRRIHTRHIKSALALWNYADASARFIFHGMAEDGKKRKLLDALEKRGEMTKTEIRDLFQRHIKKERLESILSELIAEGRIVKESRKTNGRPRVIFKISSSTKTLKPKKGTLSEEKPGLMSQKTLITQSMDIKKQDDGYVDSILNSDPGIEPEEEGYIGF